MSNTTKITATKADVPAQSKGEKDVIQEAIAADAMIDALKKIEDQLADGVNVRVQVSEDGAVTLEVIEDGAVKKLAGKAKGLFQRNKKIILATAALTVTSVALKVIAARQVELEADIVESSDDVSTDA